MENVLSCLFSHTLNKTLSLLCKQQEERELGKEFAKNLGKVIKSGQKVLQSLKITKDIRVEPLR
jgi:hypothetical protein